MDFWLEPHHLKKKTKHTLLRLHHEALVACKKSDAASKVMVELLGSYMEDNASQARDDAHRYIVQAFKIQMHSFLIIFLL